MKTLDIQKSSELFRQITLLSGKVNELRGVVQNPDFVNEENAQENYEIFYNSYKEIIRKLDDIAEEVYQLHDEVLSV